MIPMIQISTGVQVRLFVSQRVSDKIPKSLNCSAEIGNIARDGIQTKHWQEDLRQLILDEAAGADLTGFAQQLGICEKCINKK